MKNETGQKWKIAVIGSKGYNSDYGGVEKVVHTLCRDLSSVYHFIVFGNRHYCTILKDASQPVQIRNYNLPRKKLFGAGLLSFLATLHSLILRADLFYFHACGPGLFTFIPRLLNKKVIWHYHGPDYQRALASLKPIEGKHSLLKEVIERFRYMMLYAGEYIGVHGAHRIFVLGDVHESYLQKKFPRYSDKIVKINNYPHLYSGEKESDESVLPLMKKPFILSVSRLVAEKRIDLLISAFKGISGDYPELHLIIVGDGGEERALRKRAASHPRIIFSGHIPHNVVQHFYHNATLFCLCSTIEGQSLSLLEALSVSCPVLASDIPANVAFGDEFITFFRKDDRFDLMKQLRFLLENCNSRQEKARLGQLYVNKCHSREAFMKTISSTFKEVLSVR